MFKHQAEQQCSETQNNIFIARQPIFRRNKRIFGYELLFRSGLDNFFDTSQNGDQATSKVITNSFLVLGISNVTKGKRAFINFTEDLLINEYPALLPKEIIIIEVLEDVKASPDVVRACTSLVKKGFILALDDFFYNPTLKPLIKLAKIIKFDISLMDRQELTRQVELVKRINVKILAERVETIADFEECKAMGFDFFQGYFFSKPKIVAGKDIPGSKIQYLQILRQLQDENYNFSKVAALIQTDPSLSYKLLKYVNSAYFSLRQEISSLQSAIAMVGEFNLRKWLSLMMLSYLAKDKPPELIRLCILRARFCELIGELLVGPGGGTGKYYTVGMFSLLEAILDQPMDKLLKEIALCDEIKTTLLEQAKGNLHYTLELVKAYEKGDWVNVLSLTDAVAVPIDRLPLLYDDALRMLDLFEIN